MFILRYRIKVLLKQTFNYLFVYSTLRLGTLYSPLVCSLLRSKNIIVSHQLFTFCFTVKEHFKIYIISVALRLDVFP